MEIRKIQMEDSNNYLDMLLNLDSKYVDEFFMAKIYNS